MALPAAAPSVERCRQRPCAAHRGLLDLLEPGLEAHDYPQPIARRSVRCPASFAKRSSGAMRDCLIRRGTGGDELGIELVVLGSPQVHPRIGFDLNGLQDENREAPSSQVIDHPAFIAAARLNADPLHTGPAKFRRQPPPACGRVVDLPAFCAAMHRDVELGFRCIDSQPSC